MFDPDRNWRDWLEGEDPGRAVAESTVFLERVRDGCSSTPSIDALAAAAESQLDGPGGNPLLLVRAIEAAEPAFRNLEASRQLDFATRLDLRIRLWTLHARGKHCYGDSRGAFEGTLALITWLEHLVDGLDSLRDVVSRPDNLVAGQVVEVLGLYAASVRRAQLSPRTFESCVQRGRSLIAAYVGLDVSPDVRHEISAYPRSHAAVMQWLYLLMSQRRRDDAALIELLFEQDVRFRPLHSRGQATTPLRDFEYARYHGRLGEARRLQVVASTSVSQAQLGRHEAMILKHGYMDLGEAA